MYPRALLWLPMSVGLMTAPCWGAAPVIYSAAAYESPVRADPDDLLLIPGYGFAGDDVVVYRAIGDTTRPLVAPAGIPKTSTDMLGVVDMASVVDTPYSLTIHLPASMTKDQSYALWVVNSRGEWSNGVRINDARPLWISPNELYSRQLSGGLPRSLKVVGRNLQPAPGVVTRIRLLGSSASYTLSAAQSQASGPAIDRYVAIVSLPARVPPGTYQVQVNRDGHSWVALQTDSRNIPQSLRVMADPPPQAQFPVGRYTFGNCDPAGGHCAAVSQPCRPTAANDQTLCIVAAIAAARAAGGGVVEFGKGTWHMDDAGTWLPGHMYSNNGVGVDGILVPMGVSLHGTGRGETTLVRGARWDMHVPSFTLLGHNTVSRFTFRETRVFRTGDRGTGLLMLGPRWDRAQAYGPGTSLDIDHVTITDNEFDKPFIAIGNDGLGIDHLIITRNTFGAFATALEFEGNSHLPDHRYRYSDSIVAYNTFYPGSSLDLASGQGTVATGLSGGLRTDFSNNVADGTSTAYLYDPLSDAKGWRAAFFWTLYDNVEATLVSLNTATCTGDKDGDGEAISYDNNHNRPAFLDLAVPVIAASVASVVPTGHITVQGSLIDKQVSYGATIDVSPVSKYYVGDWIQVVRGPGIGQARKITAITTGANAFGPTVTFAVTPAFNVPPQTNSLVTVGRVFWQTYTVGNTIDHRAPPCQKSNRTRHSGGLIVLYASTVDSVVEANAQYDTSGILVAHKYELIDATAGIAFPSAFIESSNEIRNNIVDGAYDNDDTTAQALSGIYLGYGATPHTAPPPTISFGLSISHNLISHAGASNGAISLKKGWYTGPVSGVFHGITPWKIADATLIFKNTLEDIGQPHATRVGIGLSANDASTPIEWRSVLYGNVRMGTPPHHTLIDLGTQTIAYCPGVRSDSFECTLPPTDLAVETIDAPATAPLGTTVSYTVLVTNRGPNAASGATLSVEPSAGLEIRSMSGIGAICDTHDPNVNLCQLGSVAAGATARVDIAATLTAVGEARSTFSASHREPDTDVRNDSVVVLMRGLSPNGGEPATHPVMLGLGRLSEQRK